MKDDDAKGAPTAAAPERPKEPTPREALGGAGSPAKRSFNVPAAPSMELPKGGGAIRGMGETFKVNAATGTGSFGVPLPITPSPRGLSPSLGLSYDSGSGNSPFGLGWSVGVPSISRKTDKKVPEYLDSEDSDLFLLSGAEDLVPWLNSSGARIESSGAVTIPGVGAAVELRQRYRPRVEGSFAIIERVTTTVVSTGARTVHWETRTSDNVKSTFGASAAARVADPNSSYPHKVFSWLLEKTEDDRGNVVRYEYKGENDHNLPVGKPSEAHHKDGLAPIGAQRYLKRVFYGNATMGDAMDNGTGGSAAFELVFDYGEHTANTPSQTVQWGCRQDMFSAFRAGFEVRTYRLCRRVLMFHRFATLTPNPYLVRSLELTYEENKRFSKLTSATVKGHLWDGSAYVTKSLPRVSFAYTPDALSSSLTDLTTEELGDDYPQTLVGSRAEWVDLDQEGLPGLLIDYGGVHKYKRNVGGKLYGGAALESVPSIASQPAQLMDIAGAGTLSMVLKSGNSSGFVERTPTGWGAFTPFASFPNVDLNDPNLRFLDLNGDGFDDILITRGDHLVWYPSLAREGYGPGRRVPVDADAELGPRVVFAEQTAVVFVADMNGDGLADIVRVTHSGVVYWPNLGHGRFGVAVRMNTAPWLAGNQFLFDGRRVRLVDLDGTGCADLCFFDDDGTFKVYRNESGNGFDEGASFPIPYDAQHTGQFVDFYGTGTSAFIFYLRSAPGFLAKMWDPLQHEKPHLLREVDNHMGKIVRLQYAASTKFYVEDRKAGRPWVTKLPFPVHVVERVETYDAIRKARFVSTYSFHHGHYDTYEREFRGFGRVDQQDTEFFGADNGKGLFPEYDVVSNDGHEEQRQAPILTKTWFHTGAWLEKAAQGAQYLTEYWNGDSGLTGVAHLECALPASLTTRELREAARALRGTTMRAEVYELDGHEDEDVPLAVSESCYEVKKLQAPQNAQNTDRPQLPGVFQTVDKESRSWAYERNATDPRTSQTLALVVDAYGMVTRSAAIAYPRRGTGHAAEQLAHYVVVSESTVVHLDTSPSTGYRLGVPTRAKTWELTGTTLPTTGVFFSRATIEGNLSAATEISYEVPANPSLNGLEKRLVQHECAQYYDSASLPNALAQGSVDAKALLYRSYLLDMTPGLISGAYAGKADTTDLGLLLTEGKYVTPNSTTLQWDASTDSTAAAGQWLPSGHAVPSASTFYLPSSVVDAFGNAATIAYDTHKMLATSITDALSNIVSVVHDYRTLSAKLVTDPNGNRQEAAFDELGMLKAMAVMGKTSESLGDTLADPTVEYSYDLTRWDTAQKPNWVKVKARETHGTSGTINFQESKVFTDGSGGVVMTKAQAEPDGAPRWVGSGRTVLNNKGNPVKQYEPYFSDNFEFEDEDDIVATGVTAVITYDGLGRVERTDLPNGSYSRVERTPWVERAFDPNDTVGETGNLWAARRHPSFSPTPSAEEQRARTLALAHADTPTETHMDSLGRAFLVIAHNIKDATDEFLETRTTLDIEGQVLEVKDPLGRTCQTNVYSMAGKLLKETNIDKGARWYFHDVSGALIRKWDARGQRFRLKYDELRRSTHLLCKQGEADEMLLQRTIFGDSSGTGIVNPAADNLRGKPIRVVDGAGRVKSESYDFKGNSLASERQLATDYSTTPDWIDYEAEDDVGDFDTATDAELDAEVFTEARSFDALNRVVTATTPDGSVFTPTYNEAGLLEAVDVEIRGATPATPFVANIDYDAKGQRTEITYSSGNFKTTYDYDPLTFRLTNVLTTRVSPSETLQDLRYTFDPVGNIVECVDNAQDDLFFDDNFVTASSRYEYDAVYRLTRGEGREHNSNGLGVTDDEDQAIWNLPHPNDPAAVRRYFETYDYDQVGNILDLFHNAGNGTNTWTREYVYVSGTNRLESNTGMGASDYTYDAHGSMTWMPHLSGGITWTPFDQMKSADNSSQVTHFTYGADGQRVRKVYVDGSTTKERIYLGSFEIYREKSGVTHLERLTLHVMDGAKRIAMVETKTIEDKDEVDPVEDMFRYQLGNHLGSAVLEVDEDGLVISYEEYTPYGSSAYRSSRSGVEVSARRYRYVGLERDDETGLYSMGARYYAAWLGRWTSADPMGIGADGPGLYNYTRGSPVTMVDPGGHETMTAEQAAMLMAEATAAHTVMMANVAMAAANAAESARAVSAANATLSSGGGALGLLASAVLPDSAKQAVGGVLKKQSARSLAPVTMVPTSTADAEAMVTPGLIWPGWSQGESIQENYAKAAHSGTTAGTAEGVYGLVLDGLDIVASVMGGGGKPTAPKPKVVPPKPAGGPYRTAPVEPGGGPPPPAGSGPGIRARVLGFVDRALGLDKLDDIKVDLSDVDADFGLKPEFELPTTTYSNLYPEDLPQPVGTFTLAQQGEKWVTISSSGDVFSARGKYTFVVQDGKIVVGRSGAALGSRPAAGHVDLAQGGPVDYAGEVTFGGTKARGTLRSWNNASGHYQPKPEHAGQAGLPMTKFLPWSP